MSYEICHTRVYIFTPEKSQVYSSLPILIRDVFLFVLHYNNKALLNQIALIKNCHTYF